MAWKRGNGTVEVELANLQSKVEDWSECLDGEKGMISVVRTEAAERVATQRMVKQGIVFGGIFVGLPAFLVSCIELYKLVAGK